MFTNLENHCNVYLNKQKQGKKRFAVTELLQTNAFLSIATAGGSLIMCSRSSD